MKYFLAIILGLVIITGCGSKKLSYKPDHAFPVASQANSLELPVYVNKRLCVDMDGQPGLCSKRISNMTPLVIIIDPRPYAYRLQMTCSQAVGSSKSYDVLKENPLTIKIEPDKFNHVKSFICMGELYPYNTDQQVSAKFEVRVKVQDDEYVKREEITVVSGDKSDKVIFGVYAKYSTVCYEGGNCKTFTRVTSTNIKKGKKYFAFSESERMRYNYFIPTEE